jgi:hypothetical protein
VLLPLSLLGFPEPRGRLGAGMLLFVTILGLVGNLWLVAWKGDGVEALLRGWQDLRWSPEGAPLVQDLRAMLLPTGPLALTGWVGLVGLVVGRDLPGCRRAATWLLAVACARALGAGGELAPLLYLPGLAVGAGAMGARLGRWHLALAALCLVVGALVCGGRLDTAYNRLEGIPILARELPADGTGKVYCFPETQARLQAVPSSPAPARLALPPAVEPAEFLELLREGDVLLLSPGDALASPELYQAAREVYDTHGGGVILTPTRRLPLPWLPPRAPAGLILEGPVPR